MNLYWLIAALPVAVLGIALLNLVLWPRGRPGHRLPGTVSVLIPARDEEACIDATVRAALSSRHPVLEVLVYDDASTDSTPAILSRIAAQDTRLRTLSGEGLPEGWVGKAHACHRLAEAAQGDFLVYVDADTRLEPEGIARAAEVLDRLDAEVLTAVPRQITETWFERLVLPLLHLTYASWFPVPLVWLSNDERFMAANGQLVVLKAETYRQFGGYSTVRHEVVDDMAFCRAAKQSGLRVVFADGARMARCRMYTSTREVWEGFSKNVYEGVGGRPSALILACALNFFAFLLPWTTLPLAVVVPELLVPSLIGVSANLLERVLLARRYEQHWLGVVLHPFAVLALITIAVNSWRWHLAGTVSWRGRVYASRPERGAVH